MKNIHLLPTDKASKLFYNKIESKFIIDTDFENTLKEDWFQDYNIYITSDEEIKDGDVVKIPCGVGKVKELHWKYGNDNPSYIVEDILIYKLRYGQKEGELQINSFRYEDVKKITLTTDQDLINDGVQAIDDEFLEWFIKNPSCEEVVVEKKMLCNYCGEENCDNLRCRGYVDNVWYEIIIPKEESNYNMKDEIEWVSNNPQCKQIESCYNSLSKKCICPKETQTLDKYIQKISDFVTDNKAKTNNTIDLNAYGLGAIDALKKSRIDEMFEMLKLLVDRLDENDLSDLSATKRAKQLIKDLSL